MTGFPAPGDSHVSIRKGCDECTELLCGCSKLEILHKCVHINEILIRVY